VSIAFEVNRIRELSVHNDGLGGFALAERSLSLTFVKDYDAIPGNRLELLRGK